MSALLFLHPIRTVQWFGAALVFFALYYRVYMKRNPSATRSTAHEENSSLEKVKIENLRPDRIVTLALAQSNASHVL